MTALPEEMRLDGRAVTLVIAIQQDAPVILYWGPRIGTTVTAAMLQTLATRDVAPSSPSQDAVVALTPMPGAGFPGRPGIGVDRAGLDWAVNAIVTAVTEEPGSITIESVDAAHGIALTHHLRLSPDDDVLVASTTLRNIGSEPLAVAALAAPVIPLPDSSTRLIGFEGRWSGEFQTVTIDRPPGLWMRENRRGRTSHDSFPGLIAHDAGTTERHGDACGFHLGWSGNHRIHVETLPDGRAHVGMEALYLPGEIRLEPGESLSTPDLYASATSEGLTSLSRGFHDFLRRRPDHDRLRARPRPVHYNTWEAVYFDHDPAVLMQMADRAAAVGAERFVLDDGWFLGRRNDRAGLGDWSVDPAVYPDGLAPLIAHVEKVGMEFGLWVEPEMVSIDSDLYRAHPDWAMATPPAPPRPFRSQLVLDFGRAEVRDHIHAQLSALLADHRIGYLKWDMNSDLNQPGGANGRAAADAHVHGVYEVLDRLRAEHPQIEIESCASGGGRADYAILARTDRIWTSDSNDALDRLSIQRGFSHFFPTELMGSHVGPATCHITGRRLTMATRVQTACFGHMGMELDLRDLDDAAFAELAAGIALHKEHRGLIHSGDHLRLDPQPGVDAFGIVAADRSEALFSYTCVEERRAAHPARLRLAGLDPDALYAMRSIWPKATDTTTVTGDALMRAGWQPPRLHPGTGVILHLVRA
jgi:alpha-galactosidase